MIDEKLLLKMLEGKAIYIGKYKDAYYDPEDVCDIINQLVEESNNGWIPCKVDLPKKTNSYLVTKMCENDGNPIYDTSHEIFWTKDRKWDCERDEYCEWEVIAWREKLTPYIPEGE